LLFVTLNSWLYIQYLVVCDFMFRYELMILYSVSPRSSCCFSLWTHEFVFNIITILLLFFMMNSWLYVQYLVVCDFMFHYELMILYSVCCCMWLWTHDFVFSITTILLLFFIMNSWLYVQYLVVCDFMFHYELMILYSVCCYMWLWTHYCIFSTITILFCFSLCIFSTITILLCCFSWWTDDCIFSILLFMTLCFIMNSWLYIQYLVVYDFIFHYELMIVCSVSSRSSCCFHYVYLVPSRFSCYFSLCIFSTITIQYLVVYDFIFHYELMIVYSVSCCLWLYLSLWTHDCMFSIITILLLFFIMYI